MRRFVGAFAIFLISTEVSVSTLGLLLESIGAGNRLSSASEDRAGLASSEDFSSRPFGWSADPFGVLCPLVHSRPIILSLLAKNGHLRDAKMTNSAFDWEVAMAIDFRLTEN